MKNDDTNTHTHSERERQRDEENEKKTHLNLFKRKLYAHTNSRREGESKRTKVINNDERRNLFIV